MKLLISRACLLVATLLSVAGAMAAEDEGSQVRVKLLADRTALVPGKTTTLAVVFKIESGWHIYWQNRGEGGLETTFDWTLPDDYAVGPMRFPPPERRVEEPDAHVFILEGEPVMLTDLSVPASAKPGDKVTIAVKVSWLVCQKSCVPGDKELSLELPVVANESEAKPTDDLTFKAARREVPAAPGKAQYLSSVEAKASVDKVRPGDKFEVAVILKLAPGYHINSNQPLEKAYPATDLFHYRTEGLSIGRPRFPAGKIEEQGPPADLPPAMAKDFPVSKLSIYRGEVAIRIPIEAAGELEGDTLHIGGIVAYQACSDEKGQCYPRTAAEWGLDLKVGQAGETVASTKLPGEDAKAPERAAPPDVAPPSTVKPPKETAEPPNVAVSTPSKTTASPATTAPQAIGVWARLTDYVASFGVPGYLVLAFFGGMLMNLMPCVLPVISIKIISFVQQAKESRLRVLTLGLAFAAGILLSFIVLGLLILGLLKGLGLELQWGGQFQNPGVVIGFAAVVTALALSLFGVFTLSPPQFILSAGGQVRQEGHLSAFSMGLLATILGTACTAPGVSLAAAWAITQTPTVGMLIFVSLGLGMALPYVLLAAKPAWIKFIPRPGPWMETFEHIMGFLLLGTVVFLMNPLVVQIGGTGLFWTLVFLLFVAAAAWCYGRAGMGASAGRQVVCYGGVVVLLAGGWFFSFRGESSLSALLAQRQAELKGLNTEIRTDWPDPSVIPWVPYARERTLGLVKSGRTVFIDYTAEWCANCKYNEKVVINTPEVRDAMRKAGVVPVRADYTLKDPEIRADLERFRRAGVPMYVIIPANRPDEPIVLNEILTQGSVLEGLEKAGASTAAQASAAGE